MSDLQDPRVLFAGERTLLAWNRTALSLMAFGFVIERSGVLLHILKPDAHAAERSLATLFLGIAFILFGSATALFSLMQFRILLRSLNPKEFPPGYPARAGLLVNSLLASLGILLVAILVYMHRL